MMSASANYFESLLAEDDERQVITKFSFSLEKGCDHSVTVVRFCICGCVGVRGIDVPCLLPSAASDGAVSFKIRTYVRPEMGNVSKIASCQKKVVMQTVDTSEQEWRLPQQWPWMGRGVID